MVEREGATISVDQADEIVRRASRSAIEGGRKVLLLDEFHLVQATPGRSCSRPSRSRPPGTFFVVLADELPPELVTIAPAACGSTSPPLAAPAHRRPARAPRASTAERAAEVAAFAGGDLDRARLLATDERLALRLAAWRDLPRRLDGTGRAAAARRSPSCGPPSTTPRRRSRPATRPRSAELQRAHRALRPAGLGRRASSRPARSARAAASAPTSCGWAWAPLAGAYRDELAVAADPDGGPRRPSTPSRRRPSASMHNPNEELQLIALAVRLPTLN